MWGLRLGVWCYHLPSCVLSVMIIDSFCKYINRIVLAIMFLLAFNLLSHTTDSLCSYDLERSKVNTHQIIWWSTFTLINKKRLLSFLLEICFRLPLSLCDFQRPQQH